MLDVFELVLHIVENFQMISVITLLLAFITRRTQPRLAAFFLLWLPALIATMVLATYMGSYWDAADRGYDTSLPSIREKLEAYIADGSGDLEEIIEGGEHAPTFGSHEVGYIVRDLLSHTLFHLDSHNAMNIPVAYNKGDDWFEATLGGPMVYTSGIYRTGTESLETAQNYKLDYVADALDLRPKDRVLDIGCGWGRLVKHFSEKYKANVTGITLSESQAEYGRKLNAGNGGQILIQDAMTYEPNGRFDKIASLEMAEHVGIKRYAEFLSRVHSMLEDDGVFYFQVAGLRRAWQYEDLVWGLFMGQEIFPGADASCPLGWVSTHLERAGFEIQRVSNLGTHYSRTLDQWLAGWRRSQASIEMAHGAVAWRRWEVFLRWSVRIAREGSSTVFMFTLTKAGQTPVRIRTQRKLVPKLDSGCSLF